MVIKILKTTLKILIIAIVYLLQIYVVNDITFFGITGNLCLMAVVIITLIDTNYMAYTVATICGILSDILFYTLPCKYLITYLIVTVILIGLKKMYKQDRKLSIIIFAIVGVCISEVFEIIFYIINTGNFVNLFYYIFNIIKQCIINVCFAFVLYLSLIKLTKEG